MNSTLGCMTLALRLQIPSSAWRSGTFITPFLTCHVVWHNLFFVPHPPLQFSPYPPIPPQASISKKNTLRPGPSCTPSPPDGPGAHNVNSCSGCICPGTCPMGATMLHREAKGDFQCTNPSNRTPGEILFLLTAPNAPGRISTSFQCRSTMNPLLPVTPGSF